MKEKLGGGKPDRILVKVQAKCYIEALVLMAMRIPRKTRIIPFKEEKNGFSIFTTTGITKKELTGICGRSDCSQSAAHGGDR
jgi:hypothetical protein